MSSGWRWAVGCIVGWVFYSIAGFAAYKIGGVTGFKVLLIVLPAMVGGMLQYVIISG